MSFLLDSTLKVSLVVCAGLAVSSLLRRRSAAVRHWILAATVACAAATPLLERVVPAWSISPERFASASHRSGQPPRAPAVEAPDVRTAMEIEPVQAGLPSPSRWSVRRLLESAWMLGLAASVVVLLVGLLRLGWLAARATPVVSGPWADIGKDVALEYGLQRRIALLQSDHPSLLVTWGLLRPRVIIPAAALGWSEDRIRIVLRHELAHIRRGDWVVQLAGEALCAAYWFNPLVWIACTRLRDASEQACDDEVLKHTEGVEYAAHLVALARALKAEASPRVPAPAIARSSSLERRVRAMLDVHLVRSSATRTLRFLTGAAMFALTVGIAAAQTGPSVLSGSVVDPTGAPVPGAIVTLTSATSQAKFEVKTDDQGRYEFVPLPADGYVLRADLPGFRRAEDPIALSGKSMQRDLSLSLGELQETVSVRASSSIVPAWAPSGAVVDFVDRDGRRQRVRADGTPPAQVEAAARTGFQKEIAECKASAAGGRVRPPRKIKDVAPLFPEHLRETRQSGTVVLRGTIGADGSVRTLWVVKGAAHRDFDIAALDAVKQWQFDGTLLNCSPVEVTFNATVNFGAE